MRVIFFISLLLIISCSSNTERVMSPAEITGYKYLEKARRDLKRADIDSSLKNLQFALDMANKNNLPYLKAQVYLDKFVISNAYNPEMSEKDIEMAEEIINKEAKELMPYLNMNKAMLLYQKGKRQEGKNLIESMDKLPSELENYQLLFKAVFARDENRDDDFKKFSDKALQKSLKEEDYYLASYIYKLTASYKENRGDLVNAIDDFKKALDIDRITGNRKEIINTLEILGDLYTKINDKNNAFYYYYQGWELLSSYGDYKGSQIFLNKALSTIN
ncbi:MAG: hypothetical protein N2999_06835 [Proteobacteria bacterium]|nr:hypothetical protein [Pseudomonadota bacterium]